MSFLYPHILWLLILPLCIGLAGIVLHRHVGQAWRALVSPAHEAELVITIPIWRRVIPAMLALAALCCGILAAARPILGYTEAQSSASGRNLIIALDISRSMETNDVKPSRLEEARAAAYELIAALPTDRIGLIVFSGDADLVVPLTYDHEALRGTLEQIDRRWTASGGTNFGRLLEKAMQDFHRSAPNGTNALVILSDGEDTMDTSTDIAEKARENKLLVITVGIGTTTGAAIPDPKGSNGLWQDAQGKHVISKLNEESMQKFAEATNGSYFAMTSGTDLAAFAKDAVRKLDRHEEKFSAAKVPHDIFEYFAGMALLLLVLAILMGTEWRAPRHHGLAALLLLLLMMLAPQAVADTEDAAASYGEGLQMARENNAEAAKEAFSRALLSDNPQLQAASLYAMGNLNNEQTFNKLRDLYQPTPSEDEDSPASAVPGQPGPEELKAIVAELNGNLSAYDDALSINPSMTVAAQNKQKVQELIKKLEEEIKRLEEQQQQQQDQQNQDNQQDKQDQQNQDNKQDKQDQQNQDNQQDKQDQKNQDNQQDKQDQKNQDNQQDKQDLQNQDNKQDKQDRQNQDNQQDKQDPDNKKDKKGQQNPDNKQGQSPKQQQPQQVPQLTDEEKNRQRAASILQMHLDEEEGSPIPQIQTTQPVLKDY
ncbi:MAG: VWA domain-containing protein [Akkermansia sp.]|nr:VWA domain-containing protein [Akkermansia sp.]